MKVIPLAQKEVGTYGSKMSSEAMVRKHDRCRMFVFNLLKQCTHHAIELSVAFTDLLDSSRLVRAVLGRLFDRTPQFMLDPIGLLKMHHANIPLFFCRTHLRCL